jgi:uncharacterized caspase-like protein
VLSGQRPRLSVATASRAHGPWKVTTTGRPMSLAASTAGSPSSAKWLLMTSGRRASTVANVPGITTRSRTAARRSWPMRPRSV